MDYNKAIKLELKWEKYAKNFRIQKLNFLRIKKHFPRKKQIKTGGRRY